MSVAHSVLARPIVTFPLPFPLTYPVALALALVAIDLASVISGGDVCERLLILLYESRSSAKYTQVLVSLMNKSKSWDVATRWSSAGQSALHQDCTLYY